MLHLETVDPGTLSILKRLMHLPQMKPFHLVGGTALSLLYGHRKSIDLDLFTTKEFDHHLTIEVLKKEFGTAFEYEGGFSKFGIFCFIESVKVDIVYYPHQIINPCLDINEIRIYHPKDIAAMKIQAILGRGKKKDFWDVAEMLNHLTVQDFLSAHQEKFPTQQLLISIPQALTYFTDADESEDPISLKGQTWTSVKKIIQQKVSEYLQ